MLCAEHSQCEAYVDAELDATDAAKMTAHIAGCEHCRAEIAAVTALRGALQDLPRARASEALQLRIRTQLDAADVADASRGARARSAPAPLWRTPAFWWGTLGGVGATAVAILAAFLVLASARNASLTDDLLGAHIRSFEPTRLIEVVSSDRHTVKPWFAGHADVSPSVTDFASQGYRLVGGRADFIAGQRAAVLVYQHGSHVINVFSWASDWRSLAMDATRNGFHLAFWKVGNLQYCAVSDTGWDELARLVQLLRDQGIEDERH